MKLPQQLQKMVKNSQVQSVKLRKNVSVNQSARRDRDEGYRSVSTKNCEGENLFLSPKPNQRSKSMEINML